VGGGRLGGAALAAFAASQRRADRKAAQRPEMVVANSRYVAERVRRWWGRSAAVIAPPVDTEFFTPAPLPRQPFFLLAGRLVPYKRPQVAVAAAARAGVRLVVAGDGRARRQCEAVAGPGAEFLGAVDDETLRRLMRTSHALVHPGEEDFGMVPVEAQACGTPVIARAVGGVLDTVVDGVTGVLYPPGGDEVAHLADALARFGDHSFTTSDIRRHAEQFSVARFQRAFSEVVDGLCGGDPPPSMVSARAGGGDP
jgi:glycosyltransferase involved in cell wall biosynthesis